VDVGLPLPLGLGEVGKDISAERYGAAAGGALGLLTGVVGPGKIAKTVTKPFVGKLAKFRTRTIAGIEAPVSLGQTVRNPVVAKIESWLVHTPAGGPIRQVMAKQQRVLAEITTDLIFKVTGYVDDPARFLSNITEGAKVLEGRASLLYDKIKGSLREATVVTWEELQRARSAQARIAATASQRSIRRDAHIAVEQIENKMDDIIQRAGTNEVTREAIKTVYAEAKATWSQAQAMNDFGRVLGKATEGVSPELLGGFVTPRPQVVKAKGVLKAVGAVKPNLRRLTQAFGKEGAKDIVHILELIDRSQQGGSLGGALITIGSLAKGIHSLAVGNVAGAVKDVAATYGGLWAISRALARPQGRGVVTRFFEAVAKGDTAARLNFLAQKIVEVAEDGKTKPLSPPPIAIEVGPADLRQNTEIMLRAKEGEITPAEANRQIPRRQRAIKLLRPPPQE
jgi:hypothetical protein